MGGSKMRIIRVFLFFVLGIVLAAMVGLQAATNVLVKKQPAIAVGLFPLDGFALERIAVHRIATAEQSSLDMQILAKELKPIVLEAFRKEPLVPNALAVLALSQTDKSAKENILIVTGKINRRRLILQTQLLSLYASREDFAGTIGKLNEILAVHREQKSVYLPALVEALRDTRSVAPLTEVLEKNPDWKDRFLVSAASDGQALDNLADLRNLLGRKIDLEPETDRAIILKMANAGKIEQAYSLYQKFSTASDSKTPETVYGELNWRSEFPPFDWQLNKERDERAEVASDKQGLEISVKRGKGGVVAQRLIAVPRMPFSIDIEHSSISASVLDDISLEWSCYDDDLPVVKTPFSASPMKIVINQSEDCELQRIAVNARAWSQKGNLSGRIDSISVKPHQ
ncbi:MAG: hypothetical protein Pars2KO_22230 [Parasphingorhabdus sp.]